jgi:hypothetical protein
MEKLVIFQPEDGDFEQGFEKINIKIYHSLSNNQFDYKHKQLIGRLPPAPNIPQIFHNWRKQHKIILNTPIARFNNPRIGFTQAQITHFSDKEFENYANNFRSQFKQWLDSDEFSFTKEKLKETLSLNPKDQIQFIIQTGRIQSPEVRNILHRCPWHWWNIFPNHYKIEFALNFTEYQPNFAEYKSKSYTPKNRVKILSILGNSDDIDVQTDKTLIQDLRIKGALPRFLFQPKRSDLNLLWNDFLHILCYSGHSDSTKDDSTGWLYINLKEKLGIDELKDALRTACDRGLQLIIFNSCNGLGLAQALSDLNIPQIIVWREAVPDWVAQKFLLHFLDSFTNKNLENSLYQSVREAKEKLKLDLEENRIEINTGLPIICQSHFLNKPLTWNQIRGDRGKITGVDWHLKISFEEYNYRQVLLDTINSYALEKQLPIQRKIEIGLQKSLNTLNLPCQTVLETLENITEMLPPLTRAIDVFDKLGQRRRLLILGNPGSGKTTTLWNLAYDLIADAKEDIDQPIPIFLNLITWRNDKRRNLFVNWLVEEIHEKYQIPKFQCGRWVKNQQLLLLLDGLDELKLGRRESCLREINQFLQNYGLTEIVICSRFEEYNLLSTRLSFPSAIYLEPLNEEQINRYFKLAGTELAFIWQLFQEDKDKKLYKLAETPLMLNILTLAYQGKRVENLPIANFLEAHHKYIFNDYINNMFVRKEVSDIYSKSQSLKWLKWIAKKMRDKSQKPFLIERMQPDWLETKTQELIYRLSVRLIIGIFSGLAIALHFGTQVTKELPDLISVFIPCVISAFISGLISLVLPGLISGLIFIFLTPFIMWDKVSSMRMEVNELINTLSPILVDGIIFGLLLSSLNDQKIHIVDTIQWSWTRARRYSLIGLVGGSIYVVVRWILFRKYYEDKGYEYILYELLIFSLISTLLGALDKGIEINEKIIPNQGTWRSATNAVIMFANFLIVGIICASVYSDDGIHELISQALAVGILAFLAGGQLSGIVLIKHLTLRIILWCNGCIPWNYAQFLDYATKRIFMQKVGGGYQFIHLLLRDHFADNS